MGKKVNKKDEELTLFDEETIGSLKVKPWSFGTLFEVSPIVEEILDALDRKNIKFEELIDEMGNISFVNIARLFTIAASSMFKIIVLSVTSEKEDIEQEVKDLDIEDGVKVVLLIWTQNKDKIKNALSPLMTEVQQDQGEENQKK